MTCLDQKYRIVVQCQNIVYLLNERDFEQPKLRVLKRLREGNDHDTNDTQSDIINKLIQVETDKIVLNESTSQPEELSQMIESNYNENVN